MKINLKNPKTQETITAKLGFSWTTLFFGPLPAFFRKDWSVGLLALLVSLITLGLGQIAFAFVYNKLYIKSLLNDGFEPVDDASIDGLIENDCLIKEYREMNKL